MPTPLYMQQLTKTTEDCNLNNAEEVHRFKKSASYTAYEEMKKFMESFKDKINGIQMKHDDKNLVYKLAVDLIKQSVVFEAILLEDSNDMDIKFALNASQEYICGELLKSSSVFKRSKLCKDRVDYVAPETKALGTRWNMSAVPNSPTRYPQKIQNTMQYIPITETLRSLFLKEDFQNAYVSCNFQKGEGSHVCEKGIFRNFCCGLVFNETELFKEEPESIQIQIGSDDVELANPLQSKSTIYKITPIYFTVRNIPTKYSSKLNNIYPVVICYTDDVKTNETDFNDLWHLVVNDIGYLETFGIQITEDINIKGTLIGCTFDNLGAHTALGFAESFNAAYYCIICEMSKEECQHSTKLKKLCKRTLESYEEQLNIIKNSTKVDFSKTKGVKRHCALNNLRYYHILKNICMDIMHDIPEGVMLFLLTALFLYCFSNKIISESELQHKIMFYDYGRLSQSNIPSQLLMNKDNLNQNASQLKCLFENIPFILWDYRNHPMLKRVWVCVETLLRISQVVFSDEITESDLVALENDIYIHLNSFQKFFGGKLKPKQHNMLHYPDLIRKMGPLSHMCMMRYEAKHKVFKDYVKSTRNFINVPKSLAVKHQQELLTKTNSYTDDISYGVLSVIDKNMSTEENESILDYFLANAEINETKWFQYFNTRFESGLYVLYESSIFKISKILFVCDKMYISCYKFDIVAFSFFSNSLKLKQSLPVNYKVIPFSELITKKTFESKTIEAEIYIKANTLELKKLYTSN